MFRALGLMLFWFYIVLIIGWLIIFATDIDSALDYWVYGALGFIGSIMFYVWLFVEEE